MFVYSRSPIDFWPGWQSEANFKEQAAKEFGPPDASDFFKHYEAFRAEALELGKRVGSEGDFRQGPYVAALPPSESDYGSPVMIAWKQDNNGTTFIASPYKLPWLSGMDVVSS